MCLILLTGTFLNGVDPRLIALHDLKERLADYQLIGVFMYDVAWVDTSTLLVGVAEGP